MMSNPVVTDLSPRDVQAALSAGEALLLDVREPAEFAAERIHGAVNYPLSTFDAAAVLSSLDPARVILQCGSGKRSAMAAARCQAAGFAVTRHLAGGIGAWKAAGLPYISIDAATGAVRDPR
ncbi:MAG: rhodanese-like domain-containing protein [Caulobacter sp.]|nr:rhodanese-like domain-containing protein [Caulobacter sp.]